MGITRNSRMMKSLLCLSLIFLVSSCSTDYTFQAFSFPPGSRPDENNWQYTGRIFVSSRQTPIAKSSKKTVQVFVYDKTGTTLLDEEFGFFAASIEGKVVWEKFEEIRIELLEVGNEYAEDPYNADLVRNGPRTLLKLRYLYDEKEEKFKRKDPPGTIP